jgi:transcription termination factor Rho
MRVVHITGKELGTGVEKNGFHRAAKLDGNERNVQRGQIDLTNQRFND